MFKVAIIDDETLVRVGLKSLIDWQELGYEIVGEEDNGQSGLELIVNNKPDIVITDIKMPIMDGLEMMKKALDINKNIKFVVLSSYDEFELVKQAMEQGAEDYLLKLEMRPEILVDVLSEVSKRILDELCEKDERRSLENQIRVNKAAIKEELFRNIISKMVPNREYIDQSIKHLEIELNEQSLGCILVKVNYSSISHKYNDEDIKLLDFTIINIIEEICNEFFKSYAFKWDYGMYVVAFSKNEDMDNEIFKERTDDMCEVLIQMLRQYVNIRVSIGISRMHSGYEEFGKAFSETNEAVQHIFFKGYNNVIYHSDILKESAEIFEVNLHKFKDDLLKAIDIIDLEAMNEIFINILRVLEEKTVSKQAAYDICCQIAYFIDTSLGHEWTSYREEAGFEDNLFESIKKLETLDDIVGWIKSFQGTLCSFLIQSKQDDKHYLISKAKKYMIEHYSEYISLTKVAEFLNVSPGYLSNLFTQHTGMSFVDNVTMMKMSMAKDLLKQANYKIYEISYMLGYENACYFSKIFKKTMGISPKEYLQNSQKD